MSYSNCPNSPFPQLARHPRIDQYRGIAIVMMVMFHACYDLTFFGFARFRMLEDPFWLGWRTVIVSSFVFVSGYSLFLSRSGSRRNLRIRLVQLGGCAMLVSLVSAVLFASRWIYFGVLHFFFLSQWLTRPLLKHVRFLGPAGLVLFIAGWLPGFDFMNPRWLNWIGLASQKPFTEDYAPLIPWVGLFWMGTWAGCYLPALAGPAAGIASSSGGLLQTLGRHSLLVYMVHQPLLFGLMMGAQRILHP